MAIGSSVKVSIYILQIHFLFLEMVVKDSNVGSPWIFVSSRYSKCDYRFLGSKKLIV